MELRTWKKLRTKNDGDAPFEGGTSEKKKQKPPFSLSSFTFFTSSPRSLNAAVSAVRSPGRLAPATRTTVAEESASLSIEITGAADAAAASVGLEMAAQESGVGTGGRARRRRVAGLGTGSEGGSLAARAGALVVSDEGPAGRAVAAQERGPRRSMAFVVV